LAVTVTLNGWQNPPQAMTAGWREYTFDLPAAAVRPGLNDLQLRFNQLATLPPAPADSLLDVTALSAGEEVGDFGRIFINGRQLSPDLRGYNVVVLSADGSVQARAFDTHLDPNASAALAGFLAAVPAGAVVAVAAADEASASLTGEAVQALQALGSAADLRSCFRCSHVLIRDRSGNVREASDRLQPVGVTTNLGLTEPNAAALLEWIQIEAPED
jgi:hypothetical protein